MAPYCCFCGCNKPTVGTLVLGDQWLEFCEPCGDRETLTNGETGEVKTVREVFDMRPAT